MADEGPDGHTEDEYAWALRALIQKVNEDGTPIKISSEDGDVVLMPTQTLEALSTAMRMLTSLAEKTTGLDVPISLETDDATALLMSTANYADLNGQPAPSKMVNNENPPASGSGEQDQDETERLLSRPANAQHLLESIEQHRGKTRLTAKVLRDGPFWFVSVPDIPGLVTQARSLGEVAEMVADQASGRTGRPESDFEVSIDLLDPAGATAPDQDDPEWVKARTPIHPGEVLAKAFLEPLGISQEQLAEATGLQEKWIKGFVDGKRPLTPDAGLRLSRALELSDRYWMNLQADYEIALAREADPEATSDVASLVRRVSGADQESP